MQYKRLGNSTIEVSRICLGTMTFGEQNSEADGHAQLDYALERGINFLDTAELYAVPPRAETYGRTEEIIGTWLAKRGRRDDIVLATKAAGPGEGWVDHIRDGRTRFDRTHLRTALEGSLRRLQTDYVDLYQLHWPERTSNYFGRLGYTYPDAPEDLTPMAQTLEALGELVEAGKVRTIGLSNETAWGTMKFLELAEHMGLPRVVSVQNPYSLLNRSYEVGLAEVAHREGVGLLAYSPLAFGVLSGKYLDAEPADARLTLFPYFDRYSNEQAVAATREYAALAREHGMDPAQMALAFVNSKPFLTSNIIGATTMEQLEANIASEALTLPEEVLEGIEAIHTRYPNPSP